MAKDPEKYRLWQHEVEPPKKSARTVIAKVTPAATPITLAELFAALAAEPSIGSRTLIAAGWSVSRRSSDSAKEPAGMSALISRTAM